MPWSSGEKNVWTDPKNKIDPTDEGMAKFKEEWEEHIDKFRKNPKRGQKGTTGEAMKNISSMSADGSSTEKDERIEKMM